MLSARRCLLMVLIWIIAVLAEKPVAESSGFEQNWKALIKAAQVEGELHTFLCCTLGREGHKTLLPTFERKFGIKVINNTGRSSQQIERVRAERRAGIYSLDVWAGGPSFENIQLYIDGVLQPMKPLLIHPEDLDESAWFNGKLAWMDSAEEGMLLMVANGGKTSIAYNPKLVDPSEIQSWWDLLDPKWKGKMTTYAPHQPGAGTGTMFFYHNAGLGVPYMERLYTEMEIFFLQDQRRMAELVAQGAYAMVLFPSSREARKLKKQGLPIEPEFPHVLKEGVASSSGGAGLFVLANPPNPNAQKLFVNWLLTREGQYLMQKDTGNNSLRIDIPKDNVDPENQRLEGLTLHVLQQNPNFPALRKAAETAAAKIMGKAKR